MCSELGGTDLTPMSLGLSHSLSRYKLKFSPEKVDTMIVQVSSARHSKRTFQLCIPLGQAHVLLVPVATQHMCQLASSSAV